MNTTNHIVGGEERPGPDCPTGLRLIRLDNDLVEKALVEDAWDRSAYLRLLVEKHGSIYEPMVTR